MDNRLQLIERALDRVLPSASEKPARLHAAMRYAVGTGGKRLRPLVCLAAAEAVGGRSRDAVYPACAIELLHNYTLIHDDLPAMDNDRLRRGKSTVWVKFGEANAILAGDALLALAYEVAAKAPRKVPEIVTALGRCGVGVVQGQVADLVKDADVDFVYRHKTADLFVAAATMGGWAGGGTPRQIRALASYALNLGLAFQFEDDLLDGDSPYSQEKTERIIRQKTKAAVAALAKLPGKTDSLKDLALKLIGRET